MSDYDDAKLAAEAFDIQGELIELEPLVRGHINRTWVSTWSTDEDAGGGATRRYLHQRINEHVFGDVEGLMHNVEAVTRRLAEVEEGTPYEALRLVWTRSGEHWLRAGDGPWRTYDFVEGTEAFDRCGGPSQAFEVARIFGWFQHALEAPFLWSARHRASHAPHHDLASLAFLDERLEAHLDGLRVAGDEAWPVLEEELFFDEPGDTFTATVLATEQGELRRVAALFDAMSENTSLQAGIVSAIGWTSLSTAQPILEHLLAASAPEELKCVGMAALAIHRHDPGARLAELMKSEHLPLRRRALRAAGELGRSDLLPQLEPSSEADREARFWSSWSATLLGSKTASDELQRFMDDEHLGESATRLAMAAADVPAAARRIRELSDDGAPTRAALLRARALCAPQLAPWLLEAMAIPALARLAGDAWATFSGVAIDGAFAAPRPEGFESSPNDDPRDHNVAEDPDEKLRWPNPDALGQWWSQHRADFSGAERYLAGKPLDAAQLRSVLRSGMQAQRHLAALHLALRDPTAPLFEVRAPAPRQLALMA